ncbi:MAG TPA: ribbon-helix-helix protein, CopG family [Candidatus Baltobacteraceae bacterium]|jgi:Arc/MetJ-type ribon-helix-helix transcriptional regulator|nr:ribbon-helix-helix protein, CopG family [Candidatus Baltobacteraceae bacterium]
MKIRSNFYVDSKRMEALKHLAQSEETSVSDLVREGIDRVISERMNQPPRERAELRASLESFLRRYVGSGPERSLEEIEALVSASEVKNAHA